MQKVKFLITVMGIPHTRGTEFTAEAGWKGLITDEAFEILRWKRTFDNDPWIVALGVRSGSTTGSEAEDHHRVPRDYSDGYGNVVEAGERTS